MTYAWDGYSLDPEGLLFSKDGRHVDVSRKVLHCIVHLIRQRHRVVGYDELIRVVWGHDDVTNHQLTQVVSAARRALDDDGQAQRLIRTFPGLGYRWVGEVCEAADRPAGGAETQTQARPSPHAPGAHDERQAQPGPGSAPASAAPEDGRASSEAAAPPRRGLRHVAIVCIALALPVSLFLFDRLRVHDGGRGAPVPALSYGKTAASEAIWRSLWRGEYEKAAAQLAALPPDLAATRDVALLEIYLDTMQGRFEPASRKLAKAEAEAVAAGDTAWQVRLLATRSQLNGASGASGVEVLAPAKTAVQLLESSDLAGSPALMGEALQARGYGYMKTLDYDQAMRDLARARELLLEVGRTRDAADSADTLARIHMRAGRYQQALELFEEVGEYSRASDFPVQEIFARNAMTKIHIELLRWDEALASSERSMRLLREVPDSERRTRVMLLRARALTGVGRLREAEALIAEARAAGDPRYSTVTAAAYHLAAGALDAALVDALEAQAFAGHGPYDTLLLESEEGALLLWLIAAQARAARGGAMPQPSPAQKALLEAPTSTVGAIASGRWFWSQGEYGAADIVLRRALAEARLQGHLYQMLLAAEPLIDSSIERGDLEQADRTLQELWGYAPTTLERDYQANLLRLRLALARDDASSARAAYRASRALAGERALPAGLGPPAGPGAPR